MSVGLREVATFRTSGNIVFATPAERVDELTVRLEEALAGALGYDVPVFLRTAQEIRDVARREPFPRAVVEATTGKLQVVLLSTAPDARARSEVLAMATEEDRLAFGDRELYWLPSNGISGSALDVKAIERLLGPTTARTKGTVELLAAKYFS